MGLKWETGRTKQTLNWHGCRRGLTSMTLFDQKFAVTTPVDMHPGNICQCVKTVKHSQLPHSPHCWHQAVPKNTAEWHLKQTRFIVAPESHINPPQQRIPREVMWKETAACNILKHPTYILHGNLSSRGKCPNRDEKLVWGLLGLHLCGWYWASVRGHADTDHSILSWCNQLHTVVF